MGLLKRGKLKVKYGASSLKWKAQEKIGAQVTKAESAILAKLGNEVVQIRKSAADLMKEFNFSKEKREMLRGILSEVGKEEKELGVVRTFILKERKLLPYVRAVQSEMIMGKNAPPAKAFRDEQKVESTLHAFIRQVAHETYEYRNTLISQKRALEAVLKIVEDQIRWLGLSEKQLTMATMVDKKLLKSTKSAKRLVGKEMKTPLAAQHGRLGL